MNVSLFTVRHVFVEFVDGMESGIRSPECGIRNLFPWLFVENHFAFTIFFCISLFFNYRILSRKSQKSF